MASRQRTGRRAFSGPDSLAYRLVIGPAACAGSSVRTLPFEATLLNRARCPAKLVDLMAAGLRVVADDVGQTRRYMEHLSSGYLVPPRDTHAFATGVLRLLIDGELRSWLGQHARQRIMEHFAWHKLAAVVERAYSG